MKPLEHVGIAVEKPEQVAALLETLLGAAPYKAETVESDGVRTHFIKAGAVKLELLEALGPDSPVARFLERRGAGLHHLAFETPDIEATLEHVRAAGLTPLDDTPRRGADGKRIAFLHPKETHGVLIEFCQSDPEPLSPTLISYRGSELAVYTAGHPDAPPLLLLHGSAGSTQSETSVLFPRLEPDFRLIAVDFSGHGASTFPETADTPAGSEPLFTADLFADNARAVCDHFGLASTHIFGFSMGGNMALHFARQHPDRVKRLAVHAGNVHWDEAMVEAMTARLDIERIEARPTLAKQMDALHTDWRRMFTEMIPFVEGLPAASDDMAKGAAAVMHPTLVSAVDQDDLFSVHDALTLHSHLPNGRLAILPGKRHALQHIDADALARHLIRHFSDLQ